MKTKFGHDIEVKRYHGYIIRKFRDGSFDIKRKSRTIALGSHGGFRKAKEWIDIKV